MFTPFSKFPAWPHYSPLFEIPCDVTMCLGESAFKGFSTKILSTNQSSEVWMSWQLPYSMKCGSGQWDFLHNIKCTTKKELPILKTKEGGVKFLVSMVWLPSLKESIYWFSSIPPNSESLILLWCIFKATVILCQSPSVLFLPYV